MPDRRRAGIGIGGLRIEGDGILLGPGQGQYRTVQPDGAALAEQQQ